VYSASALAAAELPGMDVSLRGAVSIARRLQDPLAEQILGGQVLDGSAVDITVRDGSLAINGTPVKQAA